jgi:hypothetical protein
MDVANVIESNVELILSHVSYKSHILLEQKILHLTDQNLDYSNKLCEPIC